MAGAQGAILATSSRTFLLPINVLFTKHLNVHETPIRPGVSPESLSYIPLNGGRLHQRVNENLSLLLLAL